MNRVSLQGLCTGVGWRDETGVVGLALEVKGAGGEKLKVPINAGCHLAIEVVSQRSCIGYRQPDAASLIPCPDEVEGISSSQCQACFGRALILPCLRCNGDRCANPARRKTCVRPENHSVYLASFGPGLAKVGVARWERRRERLAEQGARAALVVARDDGQQVRRVESQFRRIGVPDRLAPTEKLRGLTQAGEVPELEVELRELFERSQPRIIGRWLPQLEAIELPSLPLLKMIPRLLRPEAGMRLRGDVFAVCGQTLLLCSDAGEEVAIEASSLVGYRLRQLAESEQSAGQMALAFG